MRHHDEEERRRFRRTTIYEVFVTTDAYVREIAAVPEASRSRGISGPTGSVAGPQTRHHCRTQEELLDLLPAVARDEVDSDHPHLGVIVRTHICDVCHPDGTDPCPHIGHVPATNHLVWIDVAKVLAHSSPASSEPTAPPET